MTQASMAQCEAFRALQAYALLQVGSASGTLTPEQFGAVGDGSHDDTTAMLAFIAALNASSTASVGVLGAKNYKCTAPLILTRRVSLVGQGSGATTITTTVANASSVIRVQASSPGNVEHMYLGGFRVVGSGPANSQQNAIEIGYLGSDGASSLRCHDVVADSMGGRGFSVYGGPVRNGPVFTLCRAQNCTVGVYAAEQCQFVGFSGTNCATGLFVSTGSLIFSGDLTDCNDYAIDVVASSGNNAHGIIHNTNVNHTGAVSGGHGYAVRIGANANSMTFNNCHIYQGKIQVTGTTEADGLVTFAGGDIDFTTLLVDGANVRFDSNCWPNAYFTSASVANNGILQIDGPRAAEGDLPAWMGPYLHAQFTYGSDADAVLAPVQCYVPVVEVMPGVITTQRGLSFVQKPVRGTRLPRVVNHNSHSIGVHFATGAGFVLPANQFVDLGADGTNAVCLATGPATLACDPAL